MEELEKCLNEIMKNTHSLVDVLVKIARQEAKGTYDSKEKNLDDMIIQSKRKKLKELYEEASELMDIAEEIKISEYGEYSDMNSLYGFSKMRAKDEIRTFIDIYIKSNYEDMQFISADIENYEESSIYQDTDQEIMRKSEFDSYSRNFDFIELAKQLENKEISDVNFGEKSAILESIGIYQGSSKSKKMLDNVIRKIKDPEGKIRFESETEKEDVLLDLTMYKVLEQYKMMNEEDNGILSKDIGKLNFINLKSDESEIQILLGISKEDYDIKVNKEIREYLQDLKTTIYSTLGKDKKKNKKIKHSDKTRDFVNKIKDKISKKDKQEEFQK